MGNDIMASKYNINTYEELLRTPNIGEEGRLWLQKILNRMKDNPGISASGMIDYPTV